MQKKRKRKKSKMVWERKGGEFTKRKEMARTDERKGSRRDSA